MRGPTAFAIIACLSACAPDPGLRIAIDTRGSQVAAAIDRLVVDLVASQHGPEEALGRPEDYVYSCGTATHQFPDAEHPELSFPLVITVRPGGIAWQCVGIRVRGFQGAASDRVIRAEQRYCQDLESGVTEATLVLDSRCLITPQRPDCDRDEVCRCDTEEACRDEDELHCVDSEVTEMFDATPVVWESCEQLDDGEAAE